MVSLPAGPIHSDQISGLTDATHLFIIFPMCPNQQVLFQGQKPIRYNYQM